MADPATRAAVPEAIASGTRPSRVATLLRGSLRWLGVVPFGVYIALGLIAPTIAIAVASFQNSGGGFVQAPSGFTWSNIDTALHGAYLLGLKTSILLSIATAIVPGIFGLLIAYAIFTAKRGNLLRQVVITASGVFANFGGVPLAFLFIAAFGSSALVTGWLNAIGINIYSAGFTLYGLSGVTLVSLYFQIPLMVLLILPALEGLRPA